MPTYQNTTEMVAYVETANTSQASGLRNCGHPFIGFGYGNSQYPSHGRPTWISGNVPAQTTAKIVIASANRLIEFRQVCLNSSRIAEISVPAWPIPIHHTKLMMAKPQAPGIVTPQMPTPFRNSQVHPISSPDATPAATIRPKNQPSGVFDVNTRPAIFCVTDLKLCPGAMTAYSPVRGSIIGSLMGTFVAIYASSGFGLMTPAV